MVGKNCLFIFYLSVTGDFVCKQNARLAQKQNCNCGVYNSLTYMACLSNTIFHLTTTYRLAEGYVTIQVYILSFFLSSNCPHDVINWKTNIYSYHAYLSINCSPIKTKF